jgi:hypothetical protein
MKNFSDLLAIKPSLKIAATLSPIFDNGYPICQLSVNNHILHCGPLLARQTFTVDINLSESINFSIEMSGKMYNAEKETAIEINSVCFNSFEIIPNWTHLTSYHNDHNINAPTSYLGFNGTWQLTIDKPFYHWLHEITGQGWLLKPV